MHVLSKPCVTSLMPSIKLQLLRHLSGMFAENLEHAGFSARQRKLELERLNEQLRKINFNLRQQARAGTVYAPGLMYAPTPMSNLTIGSEDDGGNQGGAATLVGPGSRPEAPEDTQVTAKCVTVCKTVVGSSQPVWKCIVSL